jgi:hypothetical protein
MSAKYSRLWVWEASWGLLGVVGVHRRQNVNRRAWSVVISQQVELAMLRQMPCFLYLKAVSQKSAIVAWNSTPPITKWGWHKCRAGASSLEGTVTILHKT